MLSIVIPCYNEAENIPFLIERVKASFDSAKDYEVIFVNNGSKDDSEKVFEKTMLEYSSYPFRVVKVEKNKGYGYGIVFGLNHAKGDVLAWTHADLQTDPQDILTGFEIFKQNGSSTTIVKGNRKKRNITDHFFTWGMGKFASSMLKANLSDINAQPKIFSKSFFQLIAANVPDDFSLDLYILYHASVAGKIIEFPVYFNKRKYGEAKGGGSFKTKFKLIKRTFAYIIEFKKRLQIN